MCVVPGGVEDAAFLGGDLVFIEELTKLGGLGTGGTGETVVPKRNGTGTLGRSVDMGLVR